MGDAGSELLNPANGHRAAVADLFVVPMLTDSGVSAPAAPSQHPLDGSLQQTAPDRSRTPAQGELFAAVRAGTGADSAGPLALQTACAQRTSARADVWSA